MKYVYIFFGGRSTTFAWTFTVAGIVGFFTARLTGAQFLTFAGIIHGWVAVRSMMDDLHTRRMAQVATGGAPAPPPQQS